ncbi:unnamed protein product [Chilo suppressalis]|uniref:Uncharacterized protein n=1 Tax=Chilo suppressalis TaxID=168631 RepID=A0ABN8BAG7_CHISP|nr:unnamed protein product [Chilo suppressalis]
MSLLNSTIRPLFVRGICTTKALCEPRSLIKMKKLQAEFQCEDGRPIWLKAGFCDRILYATTIILCYTGVLMVLGTIYDHAKPPSWKNKPC